MAIKASPLSLFKILQPPVFVRTPFLLSYLSVLLAALISLVFYFRLQPVIPIFYSLSQPSQHLASKEWIFLFPVALSVFTLFHLSLIHRFKHFDQLLVQLFSWTTLIISFVVLAALLRIITIVS